MLSLDINDAVENAIYELGLKLVALIENEPDAVLGNGCLGRMAVCFIDLRLPVTGYSLRYEYGMFFQALVDDEQVEKPDHWLRYGNVRGN